MMAFRAVKDPEKIVMIVHKIQMALGRIWRVEMEQEIGSDE